MKTTFFLHRLVSLSFLIGISFSLLSGCNKSANLTVEEHIERAKDMDASGNLKGMVIELKNAVQKSPQNPQARLMLGEAYLRFNLGEDAEKELKQAINLGVSEARVRPQLGEALILSKEYQRVLDDLQVSAEDSPRDRARILQLRGDALMGLRKFPEGCALYQEASQIDPRWHKAFLGLATCSLAYNKIDNARVLLKQGIELAPHSSAGWVMLAKLERSQGNFVSARAALDNALKANNFNLDALLEHGTILVALNDIKGAREDANRILNLYPKHYLGQYLQALILFHEKKNDSARDQLASVLQVAPHYVPALLLGGSLEYSLGNMQTAENYLAKVIQSWPTHEYAIQLLAATRLRSGRPDDAAQTLAVLNPEHSQKLTIHLLAGEIARAQKKYGQAVLHLEKAAELSPKNTAIRAQLGVLRLAAGDERAIADLKVASAMDPTSRDADKSLILGQIQQRDYQGALTSITALEKKMPKSPEPWNYRGVVYLSQQNFTKARESFERALTLNPSHFPSIANLVEMDVHDKQFAKAKLRLESVLNVDKTNLNAILGLAALAKGRGDAREYLARVNQAHNTAPQALKPIILLSNLYIGQGDLTKALVYARQANDAHPNHVAALSTLGNVQLLSGEVNNALSTYKKLAELAPKSSEAQLRLARAQIANNQARAARATLLKAQQMAPTNVAVQDALLQMELLERKFDAALRIARQFQTTTPKSPLGFEREGDIRLAQGQAAQAVISYDQAINRAPSSTGVIKLLRALHFSGNTQRVDERLAVWLTQYPKDLQVHAYAAEYYLITERNRNAIAQYEYLLHQLPEQAPYLNNLAILYQRVQDKRAQATAERALKLAPNSAGIQDTLGWILVEKGEVEAGGLLLKKAVSGAPRAASVRYHYAVALVRQGKTTEAKKELQILQTSRTPFPEVEVARKLLATL